MRLFSLTMLGCGCACTALAGGIDRSGQSIAAIFEDGTYSEFSFALARPDVSGVAGTASSGDMLSGYFRVGGAYKTTHGDKLDFGIILDQPFGASTNYPAGTGYPAAGARAKLNSYAATLIANYDLSGGFGVHGGLRVQSMNANADLGFVAGYTNKADTDFGLGYVAGISYERPDIAMRVSLTYNSAIDHSFDTFEDSAVTPAGTTTTDASTPQSVNLEFQTGIMADTLLFGSVRWVEWSEFDLTPASYLGITSDSLVSYDDDTISYTLGVGRRFNEQWSGAFTVGYEEGTGGISSNLGPTDGYTSVGLGGTYTEGNMKITGGVTYAWVGDATTSLGTFEDNTAMRMGLKVGFSM